MSFYYVTVALRASFENIAPDVMIFFIFDPSNKLPYERRRNVKSYPRDKSGFKVNFQKKNFWKKILFNEILL